jgi:alanine racemase
MANVGGEGAGNRFTRAEIDLGALRSNVQLLARRGGTSQLWAVVKANAYGHGAVPCSNVALEAGARGLCVALTQEALELRSAGIDAPLMVLSEQPISDVPNLVRHDVICVAYNRHYIDMLAAESRRQSRRTRVHLKIDTGMHRVGADPVDAVARATQIVSSPDLELHGVMTHLATADDTGHPATLRQIDEFRGVLAHVRSVAPEPTHVHVANSAATLRSIMPECTMVRSGIALYGLSPSDGVADRMTGLQPVMSLRSRVSHVQRVRVGEGVSYGLRSTLSSDTTVVTLPLGYADGIARRSWETAARVLVGGHRRRILGVVTMDQLMVDCGNDAVRVGDEAVVFGSQSGENVSVEEWAAALGTITYEIVCGVSARVPRDYLGA